MKSAGNYLVTLTVTDYSSEVATATNVIQVTPALTTQLTANRTYISAGQSVHLTNVTQSGTNGNTYVYSSVPSTGVTFTGNNAKLVICSGGVTVIGTLDVATSPEMSFTVRVST